jgi:hypothetical protein
MVVGPVMDLIAAQKVGSSAITILNRNNRLLVERLPMRVRLAFWLTNVPYWALAAMLVVEPAPLAGSSTMAAAHMFAVAVVALVSTSFHGAVLFGGSLGGDYQRVTAGLLLADLICANGYGLVLACCAGLRRTCLIFAMPVAILTASAYLKRRGRPRAYAALHGAWHALSAACMWRLLYWTDR